MRRKIDPKIEIPSLDDLFTTQAERDDAKLERVREIPLDELRPFKDHPFQVRGGEELDRMMDSVRQYGVLTPGLARPLPEGGYELVSGHRRAAVCQALGLDTMPVIVRDMTDDEAVIAMVDANLQRETILPSEKAFAYKMKIDAMNRQGKRNDITFSQVGKKLNSYEEAAKAGGDSRNQIHRYIRLTYLHPELLSRVDEGRIAFSPAVELSFLTPEEQALLMDAMDLYDCTPSHAQAIRMKHASRDGLLNKSAIYEIMAEEKPNQAEQLRFRLDELEGYFPDWYTDEQRKADVIKGLDLLKRQRERDRDAR